jgi:hypothetical protein
MINQIIGSEDRGQNLRQPSTMHTEPDALKAEAVQRLKHYTMQEEKLEHELARIRQMKHACQMMLNAFDQEKASSVDDFGY